MSSSPSSGKTSSLVELVQPELGSRAEKVSADPSGDWLCAWCLNRVANENDRFSYCGKDEFAFSNPEGIQFEIITFSRTLGCRESGVPTLDYTWFEGHAWSYCQCAACGQHLGWHYSGQFQFAGLIKCRLVRALHVRN